MSRLPGFWLALLALALGAAGCASSSSGNGPRTQRLQARAAYERGLSSLGERQPAPALAALREAVALDGTVREYHNSLGVLLLELRRPDMAMASFEAALGLDPGYAEASLNLGIALAEMGRWQEAAPLYRKALASATLATESTARQNLGLALYHLRQYPEAERELRFAIALDPSLGVAYYNLGLVLAATGQRSAARAAFQHIRETAPHTPFGEAAMERLRGLAEGG